MEKILIIFASATTVARVKKRLSAKGYKTNIRQTPQSLAVNGCSFAVLTERKALDYAKTVAKQIDVKIKAVYETDGENYRLIEKGR